MKGPRRSERRLVRWLVRLLPFDFRRDHGTDLERTFVDQLSDPDAAENTMTRLALWARSVGGIFRVAPREHLAALRQDAGYAVRTFRKHPGFTATAVLSLALGIGANTAIFTLLNSIFLHPLPVDRADRLVALYTIDDRNPGYNSTAFANYRDYRDSGVFSGLAAYDWTPMNLASGGDPIQVFGQMVTGNYFSVLGVRAAIGRTFAEDDDAVPDARPVAVLSYGLWQRRFGADPGVVGRSVLLNGQPFTVIGVAPRSFTGIDVGLAPELWVPTMMHRRLMPTQPEILEERRALDFAVVGRLRETATIAQTQSALDATARRLAATFPRENESRHAMLIPLRVAAVNPNARDMVTLAAQVLMVVVGLVLLIACANVANLLLGRSAARRREIAVRVALGASRGRIARQLLTEQALLSTVAGLFGLGLGLAARDVLWALRPPVPIPIDLDRSLDVRVLLFTASISIATALVFGIAPLLNVLKSDIVRNLKDRGDQVMAGARGIGLRGAIVAGEVALSLTALVMAGLFVRSLHNATLISPGFDVDHLAVVMLNLGGQGYTQPRVEQFEQRLVERMSSLGPVRYAAFGTLLPLFGGGYGRTVFLEGEPPPAGGNGQFVTTNAVSLHYFDTLGIALVRGRDFTADDRAGSERVVIVNQTMADKFWAGRDAIGRRFHFFDEPPVQVVGVVRDSKINSLGELPEPCAYLPLPQREESFVTFQVRTNGDPSLVVGDLAREIRALDATLPLLNLRTMPELLSQSLWSARMEAGLLGMFALVAFTLSVVGLTGVLAYNISLRTHELGVRLALGASPTQVVGLVLRDGFKMTMAGVAVGGLAAAWMGKMAAGLLYGVSGLDAPTFATVPAIFVLVAIAACYLPARRASRVDPLIALRSE